jgi:hypothetical protein
MKLKLWRLSTGWSATKTRPDEPVRLNKANQSFTLVGGPTKKKNI